MGLIKKNGQRLTESMCMADGRKKYRSDLKEHKITVKVSEAELELVDENAAKVGMNRSRYIRELIHGNGNVDSTFAEDRANLIRQVSGVAVNVNQIARMVNTNRFLRSSDLISMEVKLDRMLEIFREVLDVWRLQKS